MRPLAMIRYAALLFALGLGAGGCLPSALGNGNNGNGAATGGNGGATGANGGASGGNGDMGAQVDADFYANVAPIIRAACQSCHGDGGIAPNHFFSENPSLLSNVLAYPGLIGSSPESSRIYAKGSHEGPALTPDQAPVVAAWINEYDASLAAAAGDGGVAAKPQIMPFAPAMTGTNTVDLSKLDSSLAGQTLTFTAKMVGTSIQLSAITVNASSTMGVHIQHPLFVIWNAMMAPTPDPVDSFSGLDETVYMTTTAALGPGTLVLPNFAAGDMLNVVFSTIEAKSGMAGTTTLACKSLTMFTTNVKPLLSSNSCSTQCHVGANPTAGLNWATTPDAQLCVVALGEINTTTPAMSQLLLQPDPAQNNGHPQKVNPFTNFQTAVTNWINAEK